MKHLERISLYLLFVAILYVGVGISLPFEFFVQQKEITYSDMCVGSTTQLVTSDRNVRWPIQGLGFSQLVKFEDQGKIETVIKREAQFGYEENGIVSYKIQWDSPVLTPGQYGANTWLEIYPLPYIVTKTYIPAEQRMFNVIECE